MPNFRVLTVTTSEERMRHLLAACGSLSGGQRLFLFADQMRLVPGCILHHDWVNGSGDLVRLLERGAGVP
jgi:hypothetical protein